MENIKCVVFDFDDTIVLSEQMKKRVFFEISKSYGQVGIDYYNDNIDKRPSRFEFLKGLSLVIIKNSLIDKDMNKYLYCLLLTNCSELINNRLKESEELPNVRQFIEYLYKKEYKLFISSNADEKDIIETLEQKNLLHFFIGIYGNSLNKMRHFENIINDNELRKEQICFIGDSDSDYTIAYNVECEFIGILTERNDLKNVQCLKINDYNTIINKF